MPRRNTVKKIDKKMKREKDRGDKNEIGIERGIERETERGIERERERETEKETERELERLIEIYGEKKTIYRHKEINSGSKSNDGKN